MPSCTTNQNGAKQSGTRDESRRDLTKRLLRLRRLDNATAYSVDDTVREILLNNANDAKGSRPYIVNTT